MSDNPVKSRRKLHPHKCKLCRKRFQTKGGLNLHVKSHYPETYLLKCPHCDFSSVQKSNYSKHLAVIHGVGLDGVALEQIFKCHRCQYQSLTELQLKQHQLRKHTENKEYKCKSCDYASVEKSALAKHVLIQHTKQRPYGCKSCFKSFATSSAAARHARTHGRDKPYKCPKSFCPKQFADLKRLKEHVMAHDNVKPFPCQFCQYKSNRRDNVKLHVRRNHVDSTSSHDISDQNDKLSYTL